MSESRAWDIPTLEAEGGPSAPTQYPTPFVIALRELRAPIEVPQPRAGALRGFEFFIDRRTQRGREVLTLCMGFFARRADAERKLPVLLGTYPDACVRGLCDPMHDDGRHPGAELSGEEVIRVLEVRPRQQFEEIAAASTPTARPVVRELAQPVRPASAGTPKLASPVGPASAGAPKLASPAGPASTGTPKLTLSAQAASGITPRSAPVPVPAPAPAPKRREERDSLADTLNELRKFAFDLESDDTGSTTGVRHLRVELDSSSARKSRGPRR